MISIFAFAIIIFAVLILSVPAFIIIWTSVRRPGRVLKKKIALLGDLNGKSYSVVYAACGKPVATEIQNDITIRTWAATGYSIKLLFDTNDVCIGKTI